jgi:hypothetical protein
MIRAVIVHWAAPRYALDRSRARRAESNAVAKLLTSARTVYPTVRGLPLTPRASATPRSAASRAPRASACTAARIRADLTRSGGRNPRVACGSLRRAGHTSGPRPSCSCHHRCQYGRPRSGLPRRTAARERPDPCLVRLVALRTGCRCRASRPLHRLAFGLGFALMNRVDKVQA